MNPTAQDPKATAATSVPDREKLATALGNTIRWKMLKELALGEPRTIGELAAVGGCRYENGVKHVLVLREAGMVTQGRGKLYQIPKQYLPQPGQAVVDYGHCLLRLDVEG